MNKADLEQFKRLLLAEQAKLAQGPATESSADANRLPDSVEQASATYEQAFTTQMRNREQYSLSQIDKALTRIDTGAFGICEECGEPISIKRLLARPVTTLCISCKEEREMDERRHA